MNRSSQPPLGRKPEGIHLYKKPFFLRPWFLYLLFSGIILVFFTLLGIALFLKPFKVQAASYDLKDIQKLSAASVIYDQNGEEIGRIFHDENRRPVSFDEIPFHLIQALVAAEDSRFFEHEGVDYAGIMRAMIINIKAGDVVQGASTITQQLARKSFGLTGKSYNRKLVEAFLAIRIERELTKAEIMELYLNRIYFGCGFYGINAAAQGYFGKPAMDLSIAESATLCGLIKSPNRLSPLRNLEGSRESRNIVFDRMREEKMISREQCNELKKLPLLVNPKIADIRSSYVYEQVRQQVIDKVGYDEAARGGFQVFTTIDNRVQKAAEESLLRHLSLIEQNPEYTSQTFENFEAILESLKDDETAAKPVPEYVQGALIMIDNQTGAILAMIGGRNHEHSEFNRALQARRPSGTAFKPFVYAAAFANGRFPGSPVEDSPIDNQRVMVGGTEGILGEWGVESDYNFHEGEITARRALVRSKIAATVRLGEETGLSHTLDLAARAGIKSPLRKFNNTFVGSSEILLEELVLAYSIFPNKGTRPGETYIVRSIRESNGRTVFEAGQATRSPVRAIDAISAFQVHSCLAEVLETGTARKARATLGLSDDFIGGGKTGTAYDFTDNLFVGYNSRITCGVWAGLDKPRPIYRGAFSNDTVLPIWVDAINAAAEFYPSEPIDPPPGVIEVKMCDRSGKLATDNCYEPELIDGQEVSTSCTYTEYARSNQAHLQSCPIHGGDHPADDFGNPTLALSTRVTRQAAGLAGIVPVSMRGPTVLGEDPYNSLPAIIGTGDPAPAANTVGGPVIKAATVIMPAQVIDTVELGEAQFRIELPPPPAIVFD